MADKGGFGFNTPSKDAEKLLQQQRDSINNKKADWTKELGIATRLGELAAQAVQEHMNKPDGKAPIGLDLYEIFLERYTQLLVAKLGLDVTDLSEKVAKLQKDIDDIKLRTK